MSKDLKNEPRGYSEWFFTWNNPPDTADPGSALKKMADATGAKGYGFCLEEGEKEETPHYQGAMEWSKRIRMSTIVKMCKGIHLEKPDEHHTLYGCHLGKWLNKGGLLAGPWMKNWDQPRLPYDRLSLPETVWKPFQIELKKVLEEEPDDRHILWYWEPDGKIGKSVFAKHYCLKGNALCATGKAHNVKAAIAKWFENSTADLKYVFYCIPRSAGGEDTVDYAALEQIKDGCFFSGKYESGQVIFPNVHLVVFANFEPAYEAVSTDRWIIKKI